MLYDAFIFLAVQVISSLMWHIEKPDFHSPVKQTKPHTSHLSGQWLTTSL